MDFGALKCDSETTASSSSIKQNLVRILPISFHTQVFKITNKVSPHGVGVEHWPCNPRVNGSIPATSNLKNLDEKHKSLRSDGQVVRVARMSDLVLLVHIWFPLKTYIHI